MKFLKALYLYLKSKSVQSNPNLDIIFKTIKQLDYKADVKNIKKFNSYSAYICIKR